MPNSLKNYINYKIERIAGEHRDVCFFLYWSIMKSKIHDSAQNTKTLEKFFKCYH